MAVLHIFPAPNTVRIMYILQENILLLQEYEDFACNETDLNLYAGFGEPVVNCAP
jgi:hypothetical protein